MRNPVQIMCVEQYRQNSGERLRLVHGEVVGGVLLYKFWHAASCGKVLKVECGHRHKTKKAAEACLEPTRRKYHKIRYGEKGEGANE